ncbi:MAG: MFS transporter [Azonexus sp.]|jgi:PPP family 3-phenylpropionic acid transporter|nr:MFS transporter [Azonexus sp.]
MQVFPYWRLSGYYFFYFAFIGAFSPYFGLYLESLHFSAWDIGLLMSQMQLMRLFGPNLWGWLADRYGQRARIIRLSGVVAIAGFSAFFWLDRLPGMLLAMAVMAFFWSAALPLVETLTFDHLGAAKSRYSRIRVWGSIGFIVAVMGTGALLDRMALPGLLWVCSGILLGILGWAIALPETPGRLPTASEATTPPLWPILRQPRVAALMAACFAMSVAHGPFYVFYSIHLAANGYSKTEVGLLWSIGVLAEIAVFLGMSRLARRFSLRLILLACFVAAAVRFVLMGWGVASVGLMVFVQLLHGLTFGACHASSIAAVHAWFPGRAQGRGQALYSSFTFGAGGLLGALIGGKTWDSWGAGWTFSLAALFGLLGLLLVWRWVREPESEPEPVDAAG